MIQERESAPAGSVPILHGSALWKRLPAPVSSSTLSPNGSRRRFAFRADLGARIMAITKKDLIDRIAESTGYTQVLVKTVVQEFFREVITQLNEGDRLELRGFGVFETRTTPARMAQNPRTLEKVRVPATRRGVFKMGRLMREGVNGSRKLTPLTGQEPSHDSRTRRRRHSKPAGGA
jgi:nucleoid DNA-binding protein